MSPGRERVVKVDGVQLCTESFGDRGDPPILLVMGSGASMVWWPEDLCRMLADRGRLVIRYDHRDTGRSTCWEPGKPGYEGDALVSDAAAIVTGYGFDSTHVVGFSMGGALAQLMALDHRDRVRSLVLMSTSPAGPGEDLPPVDPEYMSFLQGLEVDWSDPESVVEYVVADWRALAGTHPFDEQEVEALARRDVEQARNFASAQNHELLGGGESWRERLPTLDVPTLVIHGDADPLFPLGHGKALSREIPGARLITLAGSGHEVNPVDWETIVRAIVDHTAP